MIQSWPQKMVPYPISKRRKRKGLGPLFYMARNWIELPTRLLVYTYEHEGVRVEQTRPPLCPIIVIGYWTDPLTEIVHGQDVCKQSGVEIGVPAYRMACARSNLGPVPRSAFSYTGRMTCDQCIQNIEAKLIRHHTRWSK